MNAPTKITTGVPAVYAKIAAIQADLARTGISKSRRNQQQGYQFRGIDEIYDALSPLLAANGLCILPRMVSREVVERTTAKGGALFYVTVEAEFDFIAAEDGSVHVVRTFGEAMDSADKATNKAMSAAYKYAALMAFAIPTEGDNDADATTHEVQSRGGTQTVKGESRQRQPVGMSDASFSKISGLLQATNTAPGVLTDYYKVKNLRELSKAQFDEAVARLEDRLAKIARDQTNQQTQDQGGDLDPASLGDCPF